MNDKAKKVAAGLLIVLATWLWALQPPFLNYDTILNNSCESLWVHAPSIVKQGEQFKFSVQAWDHWERISASYTGTISFDLLSYNFTTLATFSSSNTLPSTTTFTGMLFEQGLIPGYDLSRLSGLDCGKHDFVATILDAGLHYINATDNQGHGALSNPILVTNNEPNKRLYWGDIHGHSALGDGSGYLEEVYRFAKEVAYLDFAAVSTHDEWTDYFGSAPNFGLSWELAKAAANRWNFPNEFATLVAYEWENRNPTGGHVCVYYKGNDGPMYSHSYFPYNTQDKLWNALRQWKASTGSDVITIPHHPSHVSAWMYYDWAYYDPEFVPLVEIHSAHGSSEKMNGLMPIKPAESKIPGHHVQDALSMGHKVGLMASSDSHDGRLGHPILHTDANNIFQFPLTRLGLIGYFRFGEELPGGLTGVYADNLTRENVFNSLKSRSCYATTHVSRPILNFTINNVTVGYNDSTVRIATPTTVRNIEVFVAAEGQTTIKKITVVKNNVDFNFTTPNTRVFRYNFSDSAALTGMNYTNGIERNGQYYINQEGYRSLPQFSKANPPSTNWNGSDYSDITDVYYLRVLQNDGQIAWIGPIWVKLL